MVDSRIEKWRGWCEGSIQSQVLTMYLHRHAYQEVGAILDANAELPPSYFIEFMEDNYATTQSIAVRRQAESRGRVRTLGRLLAEVEQDASRLTREFWLGLWSNDAIDLGFAQRAWDRQFGRAVGDHLDPSVRATPRCASAPRAPVARQSATPGPRRRSPPNWRSCTSGEPTRTKRRTSTTGPKLGVENTGTHPGLDSPLPRGAATAGRSRLLAPEVGKELE
jgi:hypothetical protein